MNVDIIADDDENGVGDGPNHKSSWSMVQMHIGASHLARVLLIFILFVREANRGQQAELLQ